MNIADYRSRIRQDIIDIDESALVFSNQSVDRAIASAIEDLSRWVPNQKYYETVVNTTAQSQTFSASGITADSEVTITGAPIKPGSVSISQGGIIYTLGTDYNINYIDGVITFPTGSAIIALASETLTVAYTKSTRLFSISTLTDLRTLQSINMYSGNSLTDPSESFDLIGSYISYNKNSDIPNGYRLSILYEARHTPPDEISDGSVPEFLAELVIKGAIANLLFAKAIALELDQSGNYDSLSTLTTNLTSILADIASSRSALVLAVSRSLELETQVNQTLTDITTEFASIDAVLAAAAVFLSNVAALLVSSNAAIDVEIGVDLAAAVATFATAADAKLTTIAADLTSALAFIDTEVGTDLTDAKTAGTTLAQGFLDTGDAFIETVNTGRDPAGEYREYALAAFKKAEVLVEIGKGRIALAEEYVRVVDQRIATVNANIQMGASYIKNAETRLAQAGVFNSIAQANINASKTRLEQAQEYATKIKLRLEYVTLMINQIQGNVSIAEGYQRNAQILNTTIQNQIAAAGEVRAQGMFIIDIAERLRQEANRRYNDFKDQISTRAQTFRSSSSNSRQQLKNP